MDDNFNTDNAVPKKRRPSQAEVRGYRLRAPKDRKRHPELDIRAMTELELWLRDPELINAGKTATDEKAVRFDIAFTFQGHDFLVSHGWRFMYGKIYPPTRRTEAGGLSALFYVEERFRKLFLDNAHVLHRWRSKFPKVILPGETDEFTKKIVFATREEIEAEERKAAV